MKRLIILILIASYGLAESINNDSSIVDELDPATDLIVFMLKEIKRDVVELTVKVHSLQATSDSLQTTVSGLSDKVRNIEDDITGLTDFKTTIEMDVESMNQTIQQQIADMSSAVQASITALTDENEEIQQQVDDLSVKEQTDYNELVADISALKTTVQDNYEELTGNTDAPLLCGPLSNGYNYAWVSTKYTWDQARRNCQDDGGSLAYHGLDSLDFREQLICGYFSRCNNGKGYGHDDSEWPWIGLSRKHSVSGQWEFTSGEHSPFEEQLWCNSTGYHDQSNQQDCGGLMGIEYNDPNFLQAYSHTCDSSPRPSMCEFIC